jgi:hypothetical protein
MYYALWRVTIPELGINEYAMLQRAKCDSAKSTKEEAVYDIYGGLVNISMVNKSRNSCYYSYTEKLIIWSEPPKDIVVLGDVVVQTLVFSTPFLIACGCMIIYLCCILGLCCIVWLIIIFLIFIAVCCGGLLLLIIISMAIERLLNHKFNSNHDLDTDSELETDSELNTDSELEIDSELN